MPFFTFFLVLIILGLLGVIAYLVYENYYDDDDYRENSYKKPKIKNSIVDNYKSIVGNDLNRACNELMDDGAEFITEIEKAAPKRGYLNRAYCSPAKIAEQIYLDMKSRVKKPELLNIKQSAIVALGILPMIIQKHLANTSADSVTPIKPEQWLSNFKLDLLFDIRLKQNQGKEAVLKELDRRIDELENLGCFCSEFIQAYRDVKSCIAQMTEIQFIKYRSKVVDRLH